MKKICIIAEYNPFHNGHKYQLEEIKKKYKDSLITIIMSGNYTMRGELSILNYEEKAYLALNHGADLVIKLPFIYSAQSADIFAKGALKIANILKMDLLIFGSESNDVDKLKNVANKILKNKKIDKKLSFPKAINKAYNIDLKSNDILGVSYIKEIIKNNYPIQVETIKRTTSYNSTSISKIASASAIRNAINNNNSYKIAIPNDAYQLLKNKKIINLYQLFKYKVLSTDDLTIYNDINIDLHFKFKNNIKETNYESFINKVKTKEITINKIKRAIINIITDFKKEDNIQEINYLHIIGFSTKGQKYLNMLKKTINIPLITNIKGYDDLLKLDNKTDNIYKHITSNNLSKKGPIKK